MILPFLFLHPVKSSLIECDFVLANKVWQMCVDKIKVSNKLNLNESKDSLGGSGLMTGKLLKERTGHL